REIQKFTGTGNLFFYDAIAPIVLVDSIDMSIAYRASRYDKGSSEEGDYINCPMTKEEYSAFVSALQTAERIHLRNFERENAQYFEGCLPIEIMAARGDKALAYGPLRPVGLRDPRTGQRPWAVVQLRQDNAAGSLYNMVGFQTNLTYPEQRRVLRMIPGLQRAEFIRFGSMHRNTYINAPSILNPTLQAKSNPKLLFSGQIAGLEGYAGNVAGGWLAGFNAARMVTGLAPLSLPKNTMIGAMMHYITHTDPDGFQPMKANFGLVSSSDIKLRGKRARAEFYAQRALDELDAWIQSHELGNLRSLSQN
ncbi:MAG: methylenetetrahydrofolate--tRNA-(uracil(54)-C(5))-methyltransferase (FADH(2)-oxidizing) TrmFO, partial [Anaerolineae bacterium]|nr:methylenetetrahydrofolate--tRNA-(uracil(54)-C(5))-methyltransferase (FADH(2)-oxidizing) TrmFO [Anaerolineae bacterium]